MAVREVFGAFVDARIDDCLPARSSGDRLVRTRTSPRVDTVVVMCGEYDLSTADMLHASLDAQVIGGSGDLVVDMRQVTFIDASSLRVLVGALGRLRPDGRDLVVRAPSRPARRLLEICGFQSLIEAVADDGAVLRVASGE